MRLHFFRTEKLSEVGQKRRKVFLFHFVFRQSVRKRIQNCPAIIHSADRHQQKGDAEGDRNNQEVYLNSQRHPAVPVR